MNPLDNFLSLLGISRDFDFHFPRMSYSDPFHSGTPSKGRRHWGSKRGYKHKHGMSKGQKKDAEKSK